MASVYRPPFRGHVATAGVVILLTTAAAAAGVVVVTDQSQPAIDTLGGGLAIDPGQNLAQSITPGATGQLTEVWLPVACQPGSTLIVEIRSVTNGAPGDAILASYSVDASVIPPWVFLDPPILRRLALPSPVPIVQGRPLAIVLRSTGDCGVFQGPAGNPYAGGDAFYDDLRFPSMWTGFTTGRQDLPFRTVIAPVVSVIADFSGDGLGDVFLYNTYTGAWSLKETSASTFIEAANGTWASHWMISAAEFDGNVPTDLFLYNRSTGRFFKAFGLGNGQFGFSGSTWAQGWTTTIVDLNGDGLSDVFLYNPVTGRWFQCLTVRNSADFTYISGAWAPGWQIYSGDWNADGRVDLFLYNENGSADPNSGRWFRVFSEMDGSFGYVPGEVRWRHDWQITTADFDGDGQTDLFLYGTDGKWFRVTFTPSGTTYTGGVWARGWTIHPADFNGDGRADLFLYSKPRGQWFVVTTLADGSVSYAGGVWAPNWEISVTDFNGDRVSDLFLYNPLSGNWFQAVTTSPGVFSFNRGTW